MKRINRQQIFEQLTGEVERGEKITIGALKAIIFKEGGQYFIQPFGEKKKRIKEPRFRAELHAEAARREEEQNGFKGET